MSKDRLLTCCRTLAFVVGFTTFLSNCIEYSKIRGSDKISQVLVPQCSKKMSFGSNALLWLFTFIWIAKLFQYILDIHRLRRMHDFFHYLLGISDTDIQTISWQEVVSRLMALRDSNPTTSATTSAKHRAFLGTQSKQRMDAHDIANRLMRKENYLIALFNKDVLDLTLPVPFLRNRQLFSRTLEWNINFCIINYVFNDEGHLRPIFLKDTHRRALSDALRRRFIFAGIMNIVAAPFIVSYFLMHYFFRYFSEYQKNPSQIGSRQYTPLAEWKFREFNELWHLFQRRINMSFPFASRYIDQFPKDKTVQISGFVAFIAGALASVLALASVIDPELFLGFEITPDRTVLFYLSIFGSIWAVARGLVPEENLVFDPEYALHEVIDFTHYRPAHWTGRLHSDEVRQEFAMLYRMKLLIFLEEILSMIFTPFVLCFSLPKCSDRLIDFFREFTVHVDGLGYVCSFAVFDFKKGTNAIAQPTGPSKPPQAARNAEAAQQDLRDDYFSTKDGKMLASYYGFLDNYSGPNARPGAAQYGAGAHHVHQHASQQARRQHAFHPPPAFPGLSSPTHVPADMPGANPNLVRPDRWDRSQVLNPVSNMRHSPSSAFAPQHSIIGRNNLRFGATGPGISPMPSMLLDPHHQPSTSGFGAKASRYRPGTGTANRHNLTSDTIADEDEDVGLGPSGGTGSSGADDLTGSWKMANDDSGHHHRHRRSASQGGTPGAGGAGQGMEDTDDEEEDVKAVVEGAGVLGLITQFQKVRHEGRVGGGGGVEL